MTALAADGSFNVLFNNIAGNMIVAQKETARTIFASRIMREHSSHTQTYLFGLFQFAVQCSDVVCQCRAFFLAISNHFTTLLSGFFQFCDIVLTLLQLLCDMLTQHLQCRLQQQLS